MKLLMRNVNLFISIFIICNLSCSPKKKDFAEVKRELDSWIGTYNSNGAILKIISDGEFLYASLSNGEDPRIRNDENGRVFVNGSIAHVTNKEITYKVLSNGSDSIVVRLPRLRDHEIEQLKKVARKRPQPINPVETGSQVWMLEDLATIVYKNGDDILEAKSNEEWTRCNENKIGCYCHFNNDERMNVLYNWYAVTDKRGLAPKGWKIPSIGDFYVLANEYGGEGKAGIFLKSPKFQQSNGGDAIPNASSFTAVGTGYREQGTQFGEFRGRAKNGVPVVVFYWTSSIDVDRNGIARPITVGLYIDSNSLYTNPNGANRNAGLTVRCIKEK